jgi:3-(3-hydroxy-phenyl)propionate hydroxylase
MLQRPSHGSPAANRRRNAPPCGAAGDDKQVFSRQTYAHAPDEQARRDAAIEREVVILGGGLVGLTTALDLATRGIEVLVLVDDSESAGGRAICHARKTLQIWHRLGCLAPILAQAVTWSEGRIFHGAELVRAFGIAPQEDDGLPPFVNLQQQHVETALADAVHAARSIDMRRSRVVQMEARADAVVLQVEGPHGSYRVTARWLVATGGAHGMVRATLGLAGAGTGLDERFLTSSVRLAPAQAAQHLCWFDPPGHPGGVLLMQQQGDELWRIDMASCGDAMETATGIARGAARIAGLVREHEELELDWTSVHRVPHETSDRYRHGRVLFVGDSAHQVSPHDVQGGNSGVQDAENLGWKLALVLAGEAPERLLDTYSEERVAAAREHARQSSRSAEFITPRGEGSRLLRDAVLRLAPEVPAARRAIDTGRMPAAATYAHSRLNTPDAEPWPDAPALGAPAPAVRVRHEGNDLGLHQLYGRRFVAVHVAKEAPAAWLIDVCIDLDVRLMTMRPDSALARGLAAPEGSVVLLRPDGHLCARWHAPTAAAIGAAVRRACGFEGSRP